MSKIYWLRGMLKDEIPHEAMESREGPFGSIDLAKSHKVWKLGWEGHRPQGYDVPFDDVALMESEEDWPGTGAKDILVARRSAAPTWGDYEEKPASWIVETQDLKGSRVGVRVGLTWSGPFEDRAEAERAVTAALATGKFAHAKIARYTGE